MRNMINLLEETREVLKDHGKTGEDVMWVGSTVSPDMVISWESFEKIADFEYNNGFGATEINLDLVVLGKDFFLERGEYDGSEWWEFKTWPQTSVATKYISLRYISPSEINKILYGRE